jgi:hypothetical protein
MPAYQDFPWRVGRSVGRTIYAVTGPEATKTDILIGMMDTRALAAEVVDAHNLLLGKPKANLTPEEQVEYTAQLHKTRQDATS